MSCLITKLLSSQDLERPLLEYVLLYALILAFLNLLMNISLMFFSTLTRNIRERRGSKVAINVPSKNYVSHFNSVVESLYKLSIR